MGTENPWDPMHLGSPPGTAREKVSANRIQQKNIVCLGCINHTILQHPPSKWENIAKIPIKQYETHIVPNNPKSAKKYCNRNTTSLDNALLHFSSGTCQLA